MANCRCPIGSGLKTAHCTVCHNTFTTPGNFDRHRRGGQCLAPENVGLVSSRRPWGSIWHMPGRDNG